MPNFPLIDAHVHLYDVNRLSYSWLADVPGLNKTSLIKDYDGGRQGVQIDAFVFAEVAIDQGLHLEEAEFVQKLADADPRLAGMVAHAPVENGRAVKADLAALAEHKSLRGIRRLIQTEPDPSFCLEPMFLEGVNLLAEHDLSFDICVKHWGMEYAIELVKRCPKVSFILDHVGKPDIKNGLRDPWWDQIRRLAELPNINVKISGVITEADHNSWTADDVKPYVAHAIECFGFKRAMFGSDWTVSSLTHTYPDWVAIVDDVISGASLEEQQDLYRNTAIRTYRLDI